VETFVIRIFVPADDLELDLTGVVEHAATGRSEQFRGATGLLNVVLHQLRLEGTPFEHKIEERGEGR
jgi:hypothetical protein